MKILPIFTQNIPLKKDLIWKIEHFGGFKKGVKVKTCWKQIFSSLFMLFLSRNYDILGN